MSKQLIKGLGGASPELRKFVERQANVITKQHEKIIPNSLEVMFYRGITLIEPYYTGKELQFHSCVENKLIEDFSKEEPFVFVYLLFMKDALGVATPVTSNLGYYNVYEKEA